MITRKWIAVIIGLMLSGSALGGESFRKPFDLHLEIDDKQYYEEHFEHMPYVFDNTIYLFKDDEVGVTLSRNSVGQTAVDYQPVLTIADVTFKFIQRPDDKGNQMMVLTINNRTKRVLAMDALMTVPGEKGVLKTTVIPVGAGLTNFESWPHPIVQLVLRSFKTL